MTAERVVEEVGKLAFTDVSGVFTDAFTSSATLTCDRSPLGYLRRETQQSASPVVLRRPSTRPNDKNRLPARHSRQELNAHQTRSAPPHREHQRRLRAGQVPSRRPRSLCLRVRSQYHSGPEASDPRTQVPVSTSLTSPDDASR